MASELDIVTLKRKIEVVDAEINELKAEINDVKAKRGIWSDVSTTEWLSYLNTLQVTRGSLQEEKNILLKRTPAGKSHVQFLKIR